MFKNFFSRGQTKKKTYLKVFENVYNTLQYFYTQKYNIKIIKENI